MDRRRRRGCDVCGTRRFGARGPHGRLAGSSRSRLGPRRIVNRASIAIGVSSLLLVASVSSALAWADPGDPAVVIDLRSRAMLLAVRQRCSSVSVDVGPRLDAVWRVPRLESSRTRPSWHYWLRPWDGSRPSAWSLVGAHGVATIMLLCAVLSAGWALGERAPFGAYPVMALGLFAPGRTRGGNANDGRGIRLSPPQRARRCDRVYVRGRLDTIGLVGIHRRLRCASRPGRSALRRRLGSPQAYRQHGCGPVASGSSWSSIGLSWRTASPSWARLRHSARRLSGKVGSPGCAGQVDRLRDPGCPAPCRSRDGGEALISYRLGSPSSPATRYETGASRGYRHVVGARCSDSLHALEPRGVASN